MDVEEANKFINALVKNLQVLCHGHVSFKSSIQVIGHLYLNVDSNTNIDYIVNEKVCKNDTSSTVFVSNSYHSEPKSSVKPEAEKTKKRLNQSLSNISNSEVLQPRSDHKSLRIQNVHPAFRDRGNSSDHSRNFDQQPPVKIPRFSLNEVKVIQNYEESGRVVAVDSADSVIDLCDIKKEPGEDLQSADHSNEPGSMDYNQLSSESFNQDDNSYSNQFDESMTAIPVALHDNKHNLNLSLESFSQFTDPSSTPSSSQYITGAMSDPGSLQESHFKMSLEHQSSFNDLFPRRQTRTVNRDTCDTIIDLVLGRFSIPIRERTKEQKAAIVRYYRSGKEKWMVKPDVDGFKLYFCDQEVEVSNYTFEHRFENTVLGNVPKF